ncbi:hypothetical protein NDU88_011235 [Pleurodeles waltl]|uniref:Uncharacterized protein n=1 Tax=Pleurodeles waltl TaxID=8319 RepID=A0AAV7R0T8_PLEWA|nr:hypothetical protein NDU88_011235 [Pleurodeles waltl]
MCADPQHATSQVPPRTRLRRHEACPTGPGPGKRDSPPRESQGPAIAAMGHFEEKLLQRRRARAFLVYLSSSILQIGDRGTRWLLKKLGTAKDMPAGVTRGLR